MDTSTIIQLLVSLVVTVIGGYVLLMQKSNKERDEKNGQILLNKIDEIKDSIKELKIDFEKFKEYSQNHIEELYSKANSNKTIVTVHDHQLDSILQMINSIEKSYEVYKEMQKQEISKIAQKIDLIEVGCKLHKKGVGNKV